MPTLYPHQETSKYFPESGNPSICERPGELAALDDAVMPVDTAGRDQQRGEPAVIPSRGDHCGSRLVRAEQYERGGVVTGRPGFDIYVGRDLFDLPGGQLAIITPVLR